MEKECFRKNGGAEKTPVDMDRPDRPEIEVLTGLEAVRRRPQMYVGSLENPLLPNLLLREALCCARDDALLGKCKSVTVAIDSKGGAKVRDDGPGLPLTIQASGDRTAELYLTKLYACAGGKAAPEVAETTCVYGLAVLNALCSQLVLRIFAEGFEWRQEYRQGKPVSELAIVGAAEDQGTELAFRLDESILPMRTFDPVEFRAWVAENIEELRVILHEVREPGDRRSFDA